MPDKRSYLGGDAIDFTKFNVGKVARHVEVRDVGRSQQVSCKLCGFSGVVAPGSSAAEVAVGHFQKVAAHFAVYRSMHTGERDKSLIQHMLNELRIYGSIQPEDAAFICADMAEQYFAHEIRVRDEIIEDLRQKLARTDA